MKFHTNLLIKLHFKIIITIKTNSVDLQVLQSFFPPIYLKTSVNHGAAKYNDGLTKEMKAFEIIKDHLPSLLFQYCYIIICKGRCEGS